MPDTLEDLGLTDPKDLEPVPPPWIGQTWHEWAKAQGLCRCDPDDHEEEETR